MRSSFQRRSPASRPDDNGGIDAGATALVATAALRRQTAAKQTSTEYALDHLQRHLDGETSFAEMSAGLAASGVEKWVADTTALTMTYRGRDGAALLVEKVE